MDSFHVGIAAEAFAAGFLAQAGYNVLVQYGANQPTYDLVANKGRKYLKINVKGSQDYGWGVCQNYKHEKNTYADAISEWQKNQPRELVFFYVQFGGVKLGHCPRAYIARTREIARLLKEARGGHGSTILYENHKYARGVAKDTSDAIPESWKMSMRRIDSV